MDIVGIDISKAKFDAALLLGERVRHAVFSNTEAGFQQLLAWLAKHRPDPTVPLHACLEATGNWGLELADFLHAQGVRVSIVNPARIKAYGDSELARNKTDKLDAGLIARFCRAHVPPVWVPAAAHLRELRELVRRCDALKSARVQELNRQKSGFASPAVARSIATHIEWLDAQIEAVMDAVRDVIASDPVLSNNLALVRSITGFGEVSATILLVELPNCSGLHLSAVGRDLIGLTWLTLDGIIGGLWLTLGGFLATFDDQAASRNLRSSRSRPAWPHIWRLRVLSRLICPSTGPLLQASVRAARTAS